MKEKKIVTAIKCHVGIHVVGGDMTITTLKHKAQMELLPMGVLVKARDKQFIVPYANITHIEVQDEEAPQKGK